MESNNKLNLVIDDTLSDNDYSNIILRKGIMDAKGDKPISTTTINIVDKSLKTRQHLKEIPELLVRFFNQNQYQIMPHLIEMARLDLIEDLENKSAVLNAEQLETRDIINNLKSKS